MHVWYFIIYNAFLISAPYQDHDKIYHFNVADKETSTGNVQDQVNAPTDRNNQ